MRDNSDRIVKTMEAFENSGIHESDVPDFNLAETDRPWTALSHQFAKANRDKMTQTVDRLTKDPFAMEEWVDFQSRMISEGFSAKEAMSIFAQDPRACKLASEDKLQEMGLSAQARDDEVQKFIDEQGLRTETNDKAIRVPRPIMISEDHPGYIVNQAVRDNATQRENGALKSASRIGDSLITIHQSVEDERIGVETTVKINDREAFKTTDLNELQAFLDNEVIGKVQAYTGYTNLYSTENLSDLQAQRAQIVKDPAKMEVLYSALMEVAGGDDSFKMTLREEDPRFDEPGRANYNDYYIDNGKIVMAVSGDRIKDSEVLLNALAERQLTDGRGIPDVQIDPENLAKNVMDEAYVNSQEERVRMIAASIGKNYGLYANEDVIYKNPETGEPESWVADDMKEAVDGTGFTGTTAARGILRDIYNDAVILTQDVNQVLERAGYTQDLDRNTFNKDQIEQYSSRICRLVDSAAISVEHEMSVLSRNVADFGSNPEVMGACKEQAAALNRLQENIDRIATHVNDLAKDGTTLADQNAIVKMIDAEEMALMDNVDAVKQGKTAVKDAIEKIQEQARGHSMYFHQKDGFKELSNAYPQLKNLSEAQIYYLSKSPLLEDTAHSLRFYHDPLASVNDMAKRAHDIDKIVANNGTFVEFEHTESWMFDKPIVADGALSHPVVAHDIISQAEMQIWGLDKEKRAAGKGGFPMPTCSFRVYYKDPEGHMTSQHCRVRLGDENQVGLVDILKDNPEAQKAVQEAFKDKNVYSKILYDTVEKPNPFKSEPEHKPELKDGLTYTSKSKTFAEWKADIKEKRAELEKNADEPKNKGHQHGTRTR